MKRQLVERDFESAGAEALILVRSPDAAYLLGWCGQTPPALISGLNGVILRRLPNRVLVHGLAGST
jgi:hypothetical protein